MVLQTSPTLLSLSSQWAIKLRVAYTLTHRGCSGHRDTLDKRYFNWAALISVDGVWGGMLIWVIAYVNAQLGSSQCQNTSARVSECHPTLAPTRRVDRSNKHTPQWAVEGLVQSPAVSISNFPSVSVDSILSNAATHAYHQNLNFSLRARVSNLWHAEQFNEKLFLICIFKNIKYSLMVN